MKITDIELKNYYWEKKIPIRNGKHTYTHIGMQLIEIKNDDSLGLRLVRVLTQQLKGKLELEREAGTSFSFHFPITSS